MLMKRRFVFLFLILVFLCGCNSSKKISNDVEEIKPYREIFLTDIVQLSDNRYSCSFDEVEHDFIIDFPSVVEGAPLVILLPGYDMTAEAMKQNYAFEKSANPRGYVTVYVTGSVNKEDNIRTGIGWNSGLSAVGNEDVRFIVALAEYLQETYSLDKAHTFTAGFSNGAFMNHRLAMEAQNTFTACVSVAGKMPGRIWNNRNETNHIGFFQITGGKDDLIPKHSDGSARFAQDPAIEDVIEYWAQSDGLSVVTEENLANDIVLTKYLDENGGNLQVWHLFLKDAHHSWPSIAIHGIDTNALILDFFDSF